MARQITDVRQGTVSVPLHKFPVKWLVIGIIIACVIGGGIVGGNLVFNKATPTATIQKPPVQPNPVPPAVLSENQTTPPTVAPTPEKIFFADFGDVIWPLDPEGKRFVAYLLGNLDTPGPGRPYPLYCFPLAIEKCLDGKSSIIATIPDPNIEEIGRVWETVVNDAAQNVVCKVKLTRVNEAYKYKIEFFVSPDGGNRWFPPTTFPPI